MENKDLLLQHYKNSEFYSKYKDTYYSDKILKVVFNEDIKVHRIYRVSEKSYSEILSMNNLIWLDLEKLFINDEKLDEALIKEFVDAVYIDPDSQSIKDLEGVECTADGLLSQTRIFNKLGFNQKMRDEYAFYRENPIIHFPCESQGINVSRNREFGDRIDHTLFDLKQYYDNSKDCKMMSAYKLPKTKKWLDELETFKGLVDWMGIKGSFVDDDYEVIDLEKNDGTVIKERLEAYSKIWSDNYYNNLKDVIKKHYSLHNEA